MSPEAPQRLDGQGYRWRLAPSPTGLLHLGHGRTFWTAWTRARAARGIVVLRNEDIDRDRCREAFVAELVADLRWLGLDWDEGPDVGGPFGPYDQSQRLSSYQNAFAQLHAGGWLFPCRCSRRDILSAARAPHAEDDEPVYPGTCRGRSGPKEQEILRVNWRFQVPRGESIEFEDAIFGVQRLVAGVDFGDFVVWRHDGLPSYQLAVTVDDHLMQISEVVRGADLLRSTARQILLYRALGWIPPRFAHCPLVTDASGVRLAKRHASLSLQSLRQQGVEPARLREEWARGGTGQDRTRLPG